MAQKVMKNFSWKVCIASLVIQIGVCCPFRASGIMFVEVARLFQESAVATSTMLVTSQTSLFVAAGLYPFLRRWIGPGCLAGVGVIMATMAFSLSSVSGSVYGFSVIYGIGQGFAAVLPFQSSTEAMGIHCRARFAIAVSIASCGAGVSQVLMPYLIRILQMFYDVRGTLLISGGVVLHALPFCFLLNPRVKKELPQKEMGKGGVEARENEEQSTSSDIQPAKSHQLVQDPQGIQQYPQILQQDPQGMQQDPQ